LGASLGLGYGNFGSLHAQNVIQFAYADGSIHALRPTIPFPVLLALGGYRDGVILTLED
jgi:hypothetical protein